MTTPASITSRRQDLYHLLALSVLLFALYAPELWPGHSALERPDKMDVTIQWWPGRVEWVSDWREGYFPLWNPDLFFGMPWMAYAHGGPIYPPAIALFVLFNFFTAVTLMVFLHGLIGAMGAYCLLRRLGSSERAAFLGGVVFSQSGTFFHLISQLSNLCTTAWLPWLLLALIALHERPGARNWLGFAVCAALTVMGGDSEGALYIFMLCGLALVLYLPLRRSSGLLRTAFLFLAGLALAFLIVPAMSFPLLELTHLSIRSGSSELSVKLNPQLLGVHNFLPQLLAPFSSYSELKKYSDFNSGLSPFYLGLIPLALAFAGAWRFRRDRETARWLVIVLVMLAYLWIMSLKFLAPVTSRLPVLGTLASRGRMLEEIQLLMIILFARELDRIFRGEARGARMVPALLLMAAWVLATAAFSVAPMARWIFGATIVICAAFWYYRQRTEKNLKGGQTFLSAQWLRPIATVLVLADVTLLAFFCVPRTRTSDFALDPPLGDYFQKVNPAYRFLAMNQLFGGGPHTPDLTGAMLAWTPLASPVGFLRIPLHRSFYFLTLANPAILHDPSRILFQNPTSESNLDINALVNPDLLTPQYLKLMDLAAVRYYVARDLSIKFADVYPLMTPNALFKGDWLAGRTEDQMQGTGLLRELTVPLPYHFDFESYLYPDSSLAFALAGPAGAKVQVTVTAGPGSARQLLYEETLALTAEGVPVSVPLNRIAGSSSLLALDLAGPGRVTIQQARMIRPRMPLKLRAAGGAEVYEDSAALPRALVLHSVRVLPSLPEMRSALLDPATDLGQVLLLEKPDSSVDELAKWGPVPPELRAGEKVEISYHPQSITLRARMAAPGYLVLSDAYCPGWKAREGDRPLKILRADLAFRAVFLPEGLREVTFEYLPTAFRIGLWITLATALALIAFALVIHLCRSSV